MPKKTFLTIASLTVILIASPVMLAGDGDFVFRGLLESIATGEDASVVLRLKVSGFDANVHLSNNARLRSASGQAKSLDELVLGSVIEVTADWGQNGFIATAVTVPDSDQVATVGVVDQILPGKVVVSGLEFDLDENSAPVAAQLAPGQLVAVLGITGPTGTLLATQVVSQEQFWILGRISARDDAARTITVASRIIALSEKTRILASDKSTLPFTSLVSGTTVSVTGVSGGGKLTADEVRIVEPNGRVEIKGMLLSQAQGSITLQSLDTPFVIKTDAKTQVVGTLSPGSPIAVTAILQADGSLLATRIVVSGGKDQNKSTEVGLSGTVEKIDAASGIIAVSGVAVRATNTTKIQSGEKIIKITDLKVGDKVKVTGTKQADGSVTATRIDLIPTTPPSGEYLFEGAIEQIASDGKKIVVKGITVIITTQTTIQSGSTKIKVTELKVGDRVKIAGTKQADGSVTATRIDLIPVTPPSDDYVFDGAIEQVTTDGKKIVVKGITVLISAQTTILYGSTTLKVSDLKVGDKVKIAGTKQADGSVAATKIVVITKAG